MASTDMPPALLRRVADRFRALAEPARLQLLQVLRGGELTVTDLVDATGLSQANVSKHLQLLHAASFVIRRKEGLYVFYSLADNDTVELCDIMCGRIEAEVRAQSGLLVRR
ncbi:MAG: ArsR/SmtB family transcription factor [Gemmatimonadaceae bacterium]